MAKEKITKKCPFCYKPSYTYKTAGGLVRHVLSAHACDAKGRNAYFSTGPIVQIKKYNLHGMVTIPINGIEELEDFLHDYIKGIKNPSKNSRLWIYAE